MPKAQKVVFDNSRHISAEELFTDREEPRKAFWDVYNEMEQGDYNVVAYYGIGGVGKTTLLNKLVKELYERKTNKKKLSHAFFSFEGNPGKEEFLYNFSRQVMLCHKGLECSIFDEAIAKVAHSEGKDLYEYNKRATGPLNSLVDIARSIGEEIVPYGETAGKAIEALLKLYKEKKKEKEHEDGANVRVYNEIKYLEPKIIKEKLHEYLKQDLWDTLEKRTEPFVVFLDGYENFVSIIRDGEISQYEDNWMYGAKNKLIELPNVLWVIAGRERIKWGEDVLPQSNSHRIGDLSEQDAVQYFEKAGIIDQEMVTQLYKLSHGTPAYLDLCVRNYWEISTKRTPVIEDFGKDTVDLAKRYLYGMSETTRNIMLMLAWFPKVWDREMAEEVARQMHHANYEAELEKLLTLSLFEPVLAGYRLHDTFKQVAREVSLEIGDKIQKTVFLYLKDWLLKSDASMYRIEKLNQLVSLIKIANSELFTDDEISTIVNMMDEEYNREYEFEKLCMLLKAVCDYVVNSERSVETRLECEIIYSQSLGQIGRYEEMLELSERIYQCVNEVGSESVIATVALQNLATAYEYNGLYEKHMEYQLKCYELEKRVLGTRNPATLGAVNNLANAYRNQGNYEKALELNLICYNLRNELYGEEHPDTLESLNNLAMSYQNLGDYQKARDLQVECYEKSKRILDEKHPKTMLSLQHLISSYYELGDYKKALELQYECYELEVQVFGEEHPHTLSSLLNIANIHTRLGNYEKSLEIQTDCYEKYKRILGEEHPDTLANMLNLAIVYLEIGNYEKALELQINCYEAYKRLLGEEHPDTLNALIILSNIYCGLEEFEKALELLTQCHESYKRVLGEIHPNTLRAAHNLAAIYSILGENKTAFQMFRDCYKAYVRILGEEHPDTLLSLYNIAFICENMGDYEAAAEFHEICYNGRKNVLGEEHPDTQNSLFCLLEVRRKLEEIDE